MTSATAGDCALNQEAQGRWGKISAIVAPTTPQASTSVVRTAKKRSRSRWSACSGPEAISASLFRIAWPSPKSKLVAKNEKVLMIAHRPNASRVSPRLRMPIAKKLATYPKACEENMAIDPRITTPEREALLLEVRDSTEDLTNILSGFDSTHALQKRCIPAASRDSLAQVFHSFSGEWRNRLSADYEAPTQVVWGDHRLFVELGSTWPSRRAPSQTQCHVA